MFRNCQVGMNHSRDNIKSEQQQKRKKFGVIVKPIPWQTSGQCGGSAVNMPALLAGKPAA